MTRQVTIGRAFTLSGAGLHTGRRSVVTLRPAPADHGRRVVVADRPAAEAVEMTWRHRVPSIMSTSIDLGGRRTARTIEHLMASLSSYGVDNVLVELQGDEIPIFDGSAARWCQNLEAVGLQPLGASRRSIQIVKPVQVFREGGFLRAEPGSGFEIDVTYDLLPGRPVMGWAGPVERARFVADLSRSRSFGRLKLRKLLGLRPKREPRPPGPLKANRRDPDLIAAEPEAVWTELARQKVEWGGKAPVLRGARPWRAAFVVGGMTIGGSRYPDEAVRHVALDMIGDLALAGHPLVGRVVAHNPSHEKTFALVAALMSDPAAWRWA
jgi:UDP-3-O-[3-hydroxymyristoyl] N-acetylglucosamine deacetylase